MIDGATLERCGAAGLDAALAAGVDWIQVRDRGLEADALLGVADRACAALRRAGGGGRVLVNRRCDVALAAGADGVHLGFDALPPARARALLGEAASIGVSCHSEAEVAAASGASYACLAPVFAPLSKPSSRPPLGLERLREACGCGLPVLAQGGLEARNASEAIDAGAAGIAVIAAIGAAEDPGRAAGALREALDA